MLLGEKKGLSHSNKMDLKFNHAPRNDVAANDEPHIRRWSHNMILNLVRERTIPTERPPPVGEVSANFCG